MFSRLFSSSRVSAIPSRLHACQSVHIFKATLPPSASPPPVPRAASVNGVTNAAVGDSPGPFVKWQCLDDLSTAALSTWACKALAPALPPAVAAYVHKRAKSSGHGRNPSRGGDGDGGGGDSGDDDDDNDDDAVDGEAGERKTVRGGSGTAKPRSNARKTKVMAGDDGRPGKKQALLKF